MIRSSSGTSFDGEATHNLRLLGTVLSAAVLLGIGGQSLEVARDYALIREAASALDSPRVGDPERAGWVAKMLVGEAALANSRAATQILGGMGLTWPIPLHFLLPRSWALESSGGTSGDHSRALASGLEHLGK